jgi:hypothetical protein
LTSDQLDSLTRGSGHGTVQIGLGHKRSLLIEKDSNRKMPVASGTVCSQMAS